MNRIILIGNGFDLAHGLPTRYDQFINWYWDLWIYKLKAYPQNSKEDELCKYEIARWGWNSFFLTKNNPLNPIKGKELIKHMQENKAYFKYSQCEFLKNISQSIETKGWVDIENEYYKLLKDFISADASSMAIALNSQLTCLKENLITYLNELQSNESIASNSIKSQIYAPILEKDIAINATKHLEEHINFWARQNKATWKTRLSNYNLNNPFLLDKVFDYIEEHSFSTSFIESNLKEDLIKDNPFSYLLLPDNILLLNFNYTTTPNLYLYKDSNITTINYIHGKLDDSNSVIFGYGDELDEKYHEIKNLNNNKYLEHFKTPKYLETDNYRRLLQFIDSAPFQVCVMGHSCGNSDRTLLNTIFEHDNCISIKPYFYKKEDGTDNYLDIIQNISRNFTDMKKMRDRVVNKTYCEPLSQKNLNN